jgi:hypothetical protein
MSGKVFGCGMNTDETPIKPREKGAVHLNSGHRRDVCPPLARLPTASKLRKTSVFNQCFIRG